MHERTFPTWKCLVDRVTNLSLDLYGNNSCWFLAFFKLQISQSSASFYFTKGCSAVFSGYPMASFIWVLGLTGFFLFLLGSVHEHKSWALLLLPERGNQLSCKFLLLLVAALRNSAFGHTGFISAAKLTQRYWLLSPYYYNKMCFGDIRTSLTAGTGRALLNTDLQKKQHSSKDFSSCLWGLQTHQVILNNR